MAINESLTKEEEFFYQVIKIGGKNTNSTNQFKTKKVIKYPYF